MRRKSLLATQILVVDTDEKNGLNSFGTANLLLGEYNYMSQKFLPHRY